MHHGDIDGLRTTLTCYGDPPAGTVGLGWPHVYLVIRDTAMREVNWVHWEAPAYGPAAADEATAEVEPLLRRTSEWRRTVTAIGTDYWVADAAWASE